MSLSTKSITRNPEEIWDVIDSYYHQHPQSLISHQLNGFHTFIDTIIPNVIQQSNPVTVRDDYVFEEDRYNRIVEIDVGTHYLKKPVIHEHNGSTTHMLPADARTRNMNYASNLLVTLHITTKQWDDESKQYDTNTKTIEQINLGKLPIMVGSKFCYLHSDNRTHKETGECMYDLGGYFIVNGGERVIMSQERMAENKAYTFVPQKSNQKYSHVCEIRSCNLTEYTFPTSRITSVKLLKQQTAENKYPIRVSIPKINMELPLVLVYRLLGVEKDRDIANMFYHVFSTDVHARLDTVLEGMFQEQEDIHTKDEAIEFVSKYTTFWNTKENGVAEKRKKHLQEEVLNHEFLPHIQNNYYEKGLFLTMMVKRLMMSAWDLRNYDDRDAYQNKKLDTVDTLMGGLFRTHYQKLVKELKSTLKKDMHNGSWKATNRFHEVITPTNIYKLVNSTLLERAFKVALGTGNFGNKHMATVGKVGVSQVLNRLAYSSTLSHLRRISTPIEKSGKLIQPRKLHATQWGFVCPVETPEGGSVGVVKNLGAMCEVTGTVPISTVERYLKQYVIRLSDSSVLRRDTLQGTEHMNQTLCALNGTVYGIVDPTHHVEEVISQMKRYRRQGFIHPHVSMYYDYEQNEFNIWTCANRMVRPLIRVVDGVSQLTSELISRINDKSLTWYNLVNGSHEHCPEGVIEYVDSHETENLLIAKDEAAIITGREQGKNYTHRELHPSLIMGCLAGSIPLPDHNQSPRNTYQTAMGKQAMGVYCTNFGKNRVDTMGSILSYPQRPIVTTKMNRYTSADDLPNGLNAIVGIGCYSGYNQEDSVLFNRAAVDRGLFRAFFYRTYKDEEKKHQSTGQEERFMKPEPSNTLGMKIGNYEKLDDSGFIPENTHVEPNDIIVGKVTPIHRKNQKVTTSHGKEFKDVSKAIRNNESGYVDKIFKQRNGEGYIFCKVRVRSERIPTVGDKFSSRCGQKGTIGMIIDEDDMPTTADGIKPDIIINPHAIPSRMTIGQLIECIMGKAGAMAGTRFDGTAFSGQSSESISDILRQHGYEGHGNEVLYNGRNGQQLQTQIFIGPTFYQRLKHMVEDKMHARSTGPFLLLTRQPTEGRSRDGGLRFGEMERDCMIAHGCVDFMKERLLDVSDQFRTFVSNDTGDIAAVNPEQNLWKSPSNSHQISTHGAKTSFSQVRIPYAFKLLLQELQAMNMSYQLVTEHKSNFNLISTIIPEETNEEAKEDELRSGQAAS